MVLQHNLMFFNDPCPEFGALLAGRRAISPTPNQERGWKYAAAHGLGRSAWYDERPRSTTPRKLLNKTLTGRCFSNLSIYLLSRFVHLQVLWMCRRRWLLQSGYHTSQRYCMRYRKSIRQEKALSFPATVSPRLTNFPVYLLNVELCIIAPHKSVKRAMNNIICAVRKGSSSVFS